MIVRIAVCWLLLVSTVPAADKPPRRVLLIHSFARDFEPFATTASAFRRELTLQSAAPIEFVEVSLQVVHFNENAGEQALVNFIAAAFSEFKPDLVTAVGAPAALLYDHHSDHLFPNSPFLVIGGDVRRTEYLTDRKDTVCVNLINDLPGVMEDIVELLPRTETVFYLSGVTPLEKFWQEEVLRDWSQSHPDVQVRTLNHLSFEEIKDFAATSLGNAAMVHGILDRDAAGVVHEGHLALRQLSQVSTIPIFGYARSQLGNGIVGGRLLDFHEVGTRGASAAVRLLRGEPAEQIRINPVVPGVSSDSDGTRVPEFDSRELRRWGIASSTIPPGSAIRFREASLWETNMREVALAAGLILLQAILIFFLITTRRRARNMRDNLNLTAEAANVGLWQVDLAQDRIEATAKWREIFGFPPAGTLRLDDVYERIEFGDRACVQEAVEEAAQLGKSYRVEHRIRLPDGDIRWIASRGRADRLDGREQFRTRGVSIDITERKRAEEAISIQRAQLSHLSRVSTLGVISGSLAHELNQPLGTILSNAQAARRMIEKGNADLDEIREILDEIVGEDQRANEVIERWRRLLRRGSIAPEAVDLDDCVQEVLRVVEADLSSKGVTVTCNCSLADVTVWADPVQLQQVLLNLLLNAAEAVADLPPERRTVEVTAVQKDGEVHLSIRDKGPGIEDDPERVFEPFYTTKKKGLGMGLAISRTLVISHGGRLWAENDPSGGAVFHLVLPVTEPTIDS